VIFLFLQFAHVGITFLVIGGSTTLLVAASFMTTMIRVAASAFVASVSAILCSGFSNISSQRQELLSRRPVFVTRFVGFVLIFTSVAMWHQALLPVPGPPDVNQSLKQDSLNIFAVGD